MQNEMITTQLTPHHRLYFVPTSKNLILPSKLGKTRRRLARRLVGRQVCRLGGQGVGIVHNGNITVLAPLGRGAWGRSVQALGHGHKAIAEGPRGRGIWGAGKPQPTDPSTHNSNIVLRKEMKLIEGAPNGRPALGAETCV